MDFDDIDFNHYFYFDDSSPTGLRWKVSRMAGKYHHIPIVSAGDVAGGVREDYHYVRLFGKSHRVHRVIWRMLIGPLRGMQIDHKNGNNLDNRIENLRLATNKENCQNFSMYKNNSSGKTGVAFYQYKGNTFVQANWQEVNGTHKTRSFSTHKYGLLPAFALACVHRDAMIARLLCEGATYTDRHGVHKKGAQPLGCTP